MWCMHGMHGNIGMRRTHEMHDVHGMDDYVTHDVITHDMHDVRGVDDYVTHDVIDVRYVRYTSCVTSRIRGRDGAHWC